MRNEGLTLLMETATFWMGRATEINGRLEIHDVIGPDEYTEHVNNNAYTNYLAWHNVACARQFMAMFGREDAVLRRRRPVPGALMAAGGRCRGCDPAG
jgi:hypothetical glycosyl hydrolase